MSGQKECGALGGYAATRTCVLDAGHEGDHWFSEPYAPRCPHCDRHSVSVLYAHGYHEHTCYAGHVWRIY